jgi:hypothetical protein
MTLEKPSGNPLKYSPGQVTKFLWALVGFFVTVLTTVLAVGPNLIPDKYLPWVHIVIAVATSYGVFSKPNTPPGPVHPVV